MIGLGCSVSASHHSSSFCRSWFLFLRFKVKSGDTVAAQLCWLATWLYQPDLHDPKWVISQLQKDVGCMFWCFLCLTMIKAFQLIMDLTCPIPRTWMQHDAKLQPLGAKKMFIDVTVLVWFVYLVIHLTCDPHTISSWHCDLGAAAVGKGNLFFSVATGNPGAQWDPENFGVWEVSETSFFFLTFFLQHHRFRLSWLRGKRYCMWDLMLYNYWSSTVYAF